MFKCFTPAMVVDMLKLVEPQLASRPLVLKVLEELENENILVATRSRIVERLFKQAKEGPLAAREITLKLRTRPLFVTQYYPDELQVRQGRDGGGDDRALTRVFCVMLTKNNSFEPRTARRRPPWRCLAFAAS